MPFGKIALSPKTPYFVYEFVHSEKVFYVGISWSPTRIKKRWMHVQNLLERQSAGTLTPSKRKDLARKSNSVIAAMIRAAVPPLKVQVVWEGFGRPAALRAEKIQIDKRLSEGCILANHQGNPKRDTSDVAAVLKYLEMQG